MFRRTKQKVAALINGACNHLSNLVHWLTDVSPDSESPVQAVLALIAMLAALWCLLMALVIATPSCQ